MARRLPSDLAHVLASEFGEGFVATDAADLAHYGVDRTRVWEPAPCAVVFPRTTEEVARTVRLCGQYGLPIVPSGGRTGLSGGAVATDGELVLSLQRMNRIDAVDVVGRTLRVQAGAITQAVHEHVAKHSLMWPIDIASKGSSQIGGNIATNAGGVRVIRYGHVRNWVLALEVVTASGDVLSMGGVLEKDNTGTDLRNLFIGSEGTLGIVTEATLKLTRLPEREDVLMFALDDFAAVMRLFSVARRGPFDLMAFEYFTDLCASRVKQHRGTQPPFERVAPCYVLMEIEPRDVELLDEWLQEALDVAGVADGVVAQTSAQAKLLWSLREDISESLASTGLPHKNDIAVPVRDLQRFIGELGNLLGARYPGWEVCLFGHVGDGNIHVNVMKPADMSPADFHARSRDTDQVVFELVQQYQGSISAEHGIGLLKRDFLTFSRSSAEIELLRALKQSLDPMNLLNRGKMFEPAT